MSPRGQGGELGGVLTSPKCLQRHRPSACDRFKGLSLHHWQSVIAAKELCASCMHHSDLDTVKVSECIRRNTLPHWLGSDVRDPDAQPHAEVELPPAGSIHCKKSNRKQTILTEKCTSVDENYHQY